MTLLERERQALAAAPTHTELVLRLRAIVKDELGSGSHRDDVLADLERLRSEVRRDAPELEDVVLDVMDFVVGWASPHASLHEEQ